MLGGIRGFAPYVSHAEGGTIQSPPLMRELLATAAEPISVNPATQTFTASSAGGWLKGAEADRFL